MSRSKKKDSTVRQIKPAHRTYTSKQELCGGADVRMVMQVAESCEARDRGGVPRNPPFISRRSIIGNAAEFGMFPSEQCGFDSCRRELTCMSVM